MVTEIIKSMRPKQWYKNFVLFAGIIFSMNIFNIHMLSIVLLTFFIFCTLSGSEYLINDVLDKEKDKIHPKKCKRPIASGKLKASIAIISAIIMIVTSLIISYYINISFFVSALGYFILVFIYSTYLKYIVLVDSLTISTGFVLRAIAGCVAINVTVSPWLILCTFLVALFLALGKRKQELLLLTHNANNHRKALDQLSPEILDKMTIIVTTLLIISYSLYTSFINDIWMMITIPIVIYGVFRYMVLTHVSDAGGEPELLFHDRGIITCIILWIILVLLILYR